MALRRWCAIHSNPFYPFCLTNMQGEENLGMAMTFALVTHLREKLLDLVHSRIEHIRNVEMEMERLTIEVCIDQYVLRKKEPDPLMYCRLKKLAHGGHQSPWKTSRIGKPSSIESWPPRKRRKMKRRPELSH